MQNQAHLTEYELQRAARIAANKQRMEELGVLQAAQQLNQLNRPQSTMRCRKPSTAKPRPPPAELVATRASKRIRGEPVAASATQENTGSGHDNDSNADAVTTSSSQASSCKRKQDPNAPRFELTNTQYVAPFLLTSIGVTVWELGQVYRGPFSSNYWSSRGCLFRHAYPVGYRASKEVFGHAWDMEISAGEGGPVFKVSQRGGTRSFSGPTPTRPWTDACLAFRPGQRISGPLFFGFSDVLVQRALAALYNPSELSYALYGTPLGAALPAANTQPHLKQQQGQALLEQQQSATATEPQQQQQQQQHQGPPQQQPQQQSDTALAAAAGPGLAAAPNSTACEDSSSQLEPAGVENQQQQQAGQELAAAEAFAAELQCIRGLGAATAQVLALTKALGGSRHGSVHSLCGWLAADPQHPAQLMHYLLHSEEVPRCSRQLPAWREKWVPGILQQLQAMQQQQQQQQQD